MSKLQPADRDAYGALVQDEPSAAAAAGAAAEAPACEAGRWLPLPKRRLMSLLLMLGFFNVYAMRVNLSQAAEPMQRRFGWSEPTKGMVLSSFFWGYVPGQIPGAMLAQRFGGKAVLGAGIAATAVLTLAIPLCAASLPLLYVLRALMGFGEAVTYPAANVLYTRWMPAAERAALTAFANGGAYLGTAAAFPLAGELIARRRANATAPGAAGAAGAAAGAGGMSTSWPLVFYVFGAVGCAWCVAWWALAASSPEECAGMRAEELAYVQATRDADADALRLSKAAAAVVRGEEEGDEGQGEQGVEGAGGDEEGGGGTAGAAPPVRKSASPPWRAFLTHRAAWALYLNHGAANWGAYTLMTFLPDYMDRVLHYDTRRSGALTCLPYLLMFASTVAAGTLSDAMARRTTVRRARIVVLCGSYWLSAGSLLLISHLRSAPAAVACLTFTIGVSGAAAAAINCNYLDVSPHYAGQMYGVGNSLANVAGIVTPIVTGYILGGDGATAGAEQWQLVFQISAGFYLAASAVWLLFMEGRPVAALN